MLGSIFGCLTRCREMLVSMCFQVTHVTIMLVGMQCPTTLCSVTFGHRNRFSWNVSISYIGDLVLRIEHDLQWSSIRWWKYLLYFLSRVWVMTERSDPLFTYSRTWWQSLQPFSAQVYWCASEAKQRSISTIGALVSASHLTCQMYINFGYKNPVQIHNKWISHVNSKLQLFL